MRKYNIGDKVWYAQIKCVEKTVVCPDCCGQLALTVIKGDGSQVSIACAGCSAGYEPPKVYVTYWSHDVDVSEVVIETIEETITETEYGFRGCYRAKETEIFDNKDDAEKRASLLSEQHNQSEINKIYQKEKHNHTWSWNACYHRRGIKNAERDLAYHKSKLAVAKVKSKEVAE